MAKYQFWVILLFFQSPWVQGNIAALESQFKEFPSNKIDILILGDGYTASERLRFDRDVTNWKNRFNSVSPFKELSRAFRIQSSWTPGATWASSEQKSFFHTKIDSGNEVGPEVTPLMASSIFRVLKGMNFHRDFFPKTHRYSHAYLVVLVKTDSQGGTASGRPLMVQDPDESATISACFGEDSLHELCHSFAFLRDEYISGKDSFSNPFQANSPILFDTDFLPAMKNTTRSPKPMDLPWTHLAPGSSINPDKASTIGGLWNGSGDGEWGSWHTQARCLMNGGHENWDFNKTQRGAWLRSEDKLCFWCREITFAWTFHLLGQLGDSNDGSEVWAKWVGIRGAYYELFGIKKEIADQNLKDRVENLRVSKLYHSLEEVLIPVYKPRDLIILSNASSSKNPWKGPWIWEPRGDGFVRLRDQATGGYLNIENGRLTIGPVSSGDWSAQWFLYGWVNGGFTITSRWKPGCVSLDPNGQIIYGIGVSPEDPKSRWELNSK